MYYVLYLRIYLTLEKRKMSVPRLYRSLTQRKIDHALSQLDQYEMLTPGKKILLEMGISVDNTNLLDDTQNEFNWNVHYFYISIDFSKEMRQETIFGSKEYVYSLFSHELL
jgi:hypothetical protein